MLPRIFLPGPSLGAEKESSSAGFRVMVTTFGGASTADSLPGQAAEVPARVTKVS
ncbi:hypothetical protein ACIO3S_09030 [Nocardioides sp. NPDC087217]|uniref:hypothetical protein n=1 Tax=Nocardioides sp. NPDC087217 TaxID=3364335 RepID=UPI0038200FDD